jgi:hypothetical protein
MIPLSPLSWNEAQDCAYESVILSFLMRPHYPAQREPRHSEARRSVGASQWRLHLKWKGGRIPPLPLPLPSPHGESNSKDVTCSKPRNRYSALLIKTLAQRRCVIFEFDLVGKYYFCKYDGMCIKSMYHHIKYSYSYSHRLLLLRLLIGMFSCSHCHNM